MSIEARPCPNCGAPLARNDNAACTFCGVAVEARAPAASADPSGPFELVVEDTFTIRGRGTVATGRVASGTVRTGDELVIDGPRGAIRTRCKGVEMFRKVLEKAVAGEQVGLLLDGIEKDDVARGSRIRAAR